MSHHQTNHSATPKKRAHPYWGNGLGSSPREQHVAMNETSPWRAAAFSSPYARPNGPVNVYENMQGTEVYNRNPRAYMPKVPSELNPNGRSWAQGNYSANSHHSAPMDRYVEQYPNAMDPKSTISREKQNLPSQPMTCEPSTPLKEPPSALSNNNDGETCVDDDYDVDGQDKARGQYKCGRCGAPKKGHECPYKPKRFSRSDASPRETRNVAIQVELNDNLLLRRLNIELQGYPESYTSNTMENNVGCEVRPEPEYD